MADAARAIPRAVCVTSNQPLRRTLRRTLGAVGTQVEFVDAVDAARDGLLAEASLLVIDRAVRQALDTAQLEALARGAGLIVIGESLQSDDTLAAMRARGLDHLIGDGEDPDDAELVVTSVKLLSGDIFGLEKYLAWGARVEALTVTGYDGKRQAMDRVCASAREVGARRPVVARIESVVDELLMNALYDAPSAQRRAAGDDHHDAAGDADAGAAPRRPADAGAGALLRWACDGRYFAISVEDGFGLLRKDTILEYVSRARQERGRPRDGAGGGGAGLGLYFILSSVTRFIANIAAGSRTEVICLFDLKQSGRDAESCARSLHVFGG